MPLPHQARPGIAVIGCGAWGRNHVRNASELGVLRAVHDINPDRAARAADQAEGAAALGFPDILADDSIVGIVIATPDATHAGIAMDALEAGKHVLAEKPMAMSAAQATALCERAAETARILMTGHILLYHPGFLKLRAMARGGELGELRHISCKRLHLARGAKRHALWDLCPHDVSMVLALAGRMPASVRAQGTSPLAGAPPQQVSLQLAFDDGPGADVSVSAMHPVKLHQTVVAGAGAYGVFEDTLGWEEKVSLVHPGADDPGLGAVPAVKEPVPVTPAEPLKAEIRAFLEAIAGGPAPPSDAAEGLKVVRILAAAEESLETGRAVVLDTTACDTLETLADRGAGQREVPEIQG